MYTSLPDRYRRSSRILVFCLSKETTKDATTRWWDSMGLSYCIFHNRIALIQDIFSNCFPEYFGPAVLQHSFLVIAENHGLNCFQTIRLSLDPTSKCISLTPEWFPTHP